MEELEEFRETTKYKLLDLPKVREVHKALFKMKNEKNPCPNKIPPVAFKYLGVKGFNIFYNIIYKYWVELETEEEIFIKLGLTILPKKGDLSDTNNWKGIALGDICAKTLSSIITSRLTKHLKEIGIEEQNGSQYNKGCEDATFTLKFALQILHQHNNNAFVLFVDLVKAYNSVNRELLWKIFDIFGVPQELITIIKNYIITSLTSSK